MDGLWFRFVVVVWFLRKIRLTQLWVELSWVVATRAIQKTPLITSIVESISSLSYNLVPILNYLYRLCEERKQALYLWQGAFKILSFYFFRILLHFRQLQNAASFGHVSEI